MRVFFCLFIFICLSCSKSDTNSPNFCEPVLFDGSKFNSFENFRIKLIEYSLDDLCLSVKLGISGCDADHTIEMISGGSILISDPGQIVFDFYDNSLQLCEAYFILEREYDLSPIQEIYAGEIIVKFRDNNGSVNL